MDGRDVGQWGRVWRISGPGGPLLGCAAQGEIAVPHAADSLRRLAFEFEALADGMEPHSVWVRAGKPRAVQGRLVLLVAVDDSPNGSRVDRRELSLQGKEWLESGPQFVADALRVADSSPADAEWLGHEDDRKRVVGMVEHYRLQNAPPGTIVGLDWLRDVIGLVGIRVRWWR